MTAPPRRRPPTLPRHLHAPLLRAIPDIRPDRARWVGSGWGSVAYRIPAADGEWIARVPTATPWAVADLEREVRMLPLLETRPFEVVTPRDAQLVRDGDDALVAAIHRMVPGSSSKGRRLLGRAREAHLAAIGRFLATLHRTTHHAARKHGVGARDVWTEVSRPRIEETMRLAGPASRAWLAERVRDFEALDARIPVSLIHGDLSGDHLLVDDEGRLSGVIDFAEARLSDPALDLAGVLTRFSWRDLEVVLRHYDAPIDPTFMDRVRIYIEIVPIYSVTDGYVASGAAERTQGLRRIARRAGAAATGRGNSRT